MAGWPVGAVLHLERVCDGVRVFGRGEAQLAGWRFAVADILKCVKLQYVISMNFSKANRAFKLTLPFSL
jgi:hypothetical protein